MANQKKKKDVKERRKLKSFGKADIARKLKRKFPFLTIEELVDIITEEHVEIVETIKNGGKVVFNGFLSITPKSTPARKLKSALDNKTYDIEARQSVSVKIGNNFKRILNT